MAETVTKFQVEGASQLLSNLRQFETKLMRKIVGLGVRVATGHANRAIKDATYTTVKRRTGLLKAGVRLKGYREQSREIISMGVYSSKASAPFARKLPTIKGARKLRGKKSKGKYLTVPYYWRFIEFGTSKMAARPYVKSAFEGVASQMIATFMERVRTGIETEAARLPK